MTRNEFNAKMQDIQEMEISLGFQILQLEKIYKTEILVSCVWRNARGGKVFEQKNPFTNQVEYYCDDKIFNEIKYADFTK